MKTYLIALLCLLGLGAGSAYGSGIGGGGGGGGGGVTVYSATATASFPFGLSASSVTGTGTGNGQFQETVNGDTYTLTGSSIASTVAGHIVIYTSSMNTVGDGGVAGVTPGGNKGAVQYNNAGALGGTSFMIVGTSSVTISTNTVIAVGGDSINSASIFNLYRGAGQNTNIMSVGSINRTDQLLIEDGNPIGMSQNGIYAGGLLIGGTSGNTGDLYTLSERITTTVPHQGLNLWASTLHGIDIKTAPGNQQGTGGPITLSPGETTEVTVSSFGVTVSTTVTVLASMTVTGANGLGLTAGPLAMTAQAAPTFANGNLWNDSTQNSLRYTVSGATQIVSGTMWTMTVSSSINTTATEGEIVSTNSTTGVGTLNLPANFFTAGKSIYLVLAGTYTTTGTPSLDIKIKLSTTTILDTGVVTQVAVTGTDVFTLSALITCRTTGTTGTVMATGQTVQNTNTIGSTGMDLNSTLTTTNTTIAEPIKVTVTWGTSSASNNLTFTNGFVEVKN